jgi:hypothetical protein
MTRDGTLLVHAVVQGEKAFGELTRFGGEPETSELFALKPALLDKAMLCTAVINAAQF